MKIIEWRPLDKGALKGFVTAELENGLIIKDMPVLTGKFGPWVNLPAKPQYNADGTPKLGQNGKQQYVALLEWCNRELQGKFSEAVLNLLLAEHPDALGGIL